MLTPPPVVGSFWSTADVSAFLGVPVATLDQWAHRGKGPRYRKIGKHRRYRPEDVERWLDACPTGGADVDTTGVAS